MTTVCADDNTCDKLHLQRIIGKLLLGRCHRGEAAGHTWIDATCTTTGTIEYWACPDCDRNYSDEACTTAVTVLTIEIDSTNHVHKTEHSQVDATCRVCGATEGTPLAKPTQVNDIVAFGKYEQDGMRSNGPEAIEWLVLDVQEDTALLLSRYALDSMPYHDNYKAVTWETSDLR